MTTEDRTRAIAWFEKQSKCLAMPGAAKMFGLAAEALNALDAKNEPLTLDELRGMDGEPVWVEVFNDKSWWVVIRDTAREKLTTDYGGWFTLDSYGKTWLAYRRPPRKDDEA